MLQDIKDQYKKLVTTPFPAVTSCNCWKRGERAVCEPYAAESKETAGYAIRSQLKILKNKSRMKPKVQG